MTKKVQTLSMQKIIVVSVSLLFLGFTLGIVTYNVFFSDVISEDYASTQEIEEAKNEIVTLYQDKKVDACWQVNNGSTLASDKYELTYRTIKINKNANRAIVTDCANGDTLLVKKSGEWKATTINLQIDNRVNPEWQKACQIEDITIADDTVRPENSSIDEYNLQECKKL